MVCHKIPLHQVHAASVDKRECTVYIIYDISLKIQLLTLNNLKRERDRTENSEAEDSEQ